MSISRIKQIKRILTNSDVRDPRAALIAIEAIVVAKEAEPAKKLKPVFSIHVYDHGNGDISVALEAKNEDKVKPSHGYAAIKALHSYADKRAQAEIKEKISPQEGCNGCNPARASIDELFKQFEQDIIKTAGVPGNSGEVTK